MIWRCSRDRGTTIPTTATRARSLRMRSTWWASPASSPYAERLQADPVAMYVSDEFQKPYPFQADVVVDISSVLDQKLEAVGCHVSQMFEWIPFVGWNTAWAASRMIHRDAAPTCGASGKRACAVTPIASEANCPGLWRRARGQGRLCRGVRSLRVRRAADG